MIVDLHCHSNFSDGLLTPSELLNRALQSKVEILALTDHDTLAGVAELHLANNLRNIRVINGVEISTKWRKYDIHVLAYNFALDNQELHDLFITQKENRINRALAMADKLATFGIADAFMKAKQYARNDNIGRPHFAKVMLDEGKVDSTQEAFKNYLARNKKAYVASCWVDLISAVKIVHNAGGDAVIAHPLKYKLTNTKLNELLRDFKQAGGQGIEVVSSDVLDIDVSRLVNFCNVHALLASSGSDFHADSLSRIGVGMQKLLPATCTPIWHKWSYGI